MTEFPTSDETNDEDPPESSSVPTEAADIDDPAVGSAEPAVEDDTLITGFSESELLAAAEAELVIEDIPPAPIPSEPVVGGAALPPGAAPPGSPPPDPDMSAPGASQPEAPSAGATIPPPGQAPPVGHSPPGYYGPPPARRLYRSRHDRRIGGVSAGVAEYFGIDPTVVRVATLLFAFTGVGLLAYFAAWFIIPQRPEGYLEPHRSAPVATERNTTLAFGIAALALAIGIMTGSWAVLALALIGGGVWLLSEHTALTPAGGQAGTSNFAPTAAPPTYPTTTLGPEPVTPPDRYAPPPTDTPPPPTWTAPAPQPPRERKPQRVTWIVLSLLALLGAVGIAAATGDWWDVSATRFLGIAVIIIGVGVVVGQFRGGGARGLIPLGILAALLLFPVSAVDGLLDDGVGESVYRPTSIAELEDRYTHGVGQLVVDLSRVDFAGRSEAVDIELGIGELIVIVSEETGGSVVLQAKAGEISHQLPNTNSFLFEEGVNIETGTVTLEGGDGTLDLNISVGLGTAELRSVDR